MQFELTFQLPPNLSLKVVADMNHPKVPKNPKEAIEALRGVYYIQRVSETSDSKLRRHTTTNIWEIYFQLLFAGLAIVMLTYVIKFFIELY